jgi:hypothetical protein
MTTPRTPDFLDEMIAEATAEDPRFAELLAEAERRRGGMDWLERMRNISLCRCAHVYPVFQGSRGDTVCLTCGVWLGLYAARMRALEGTKRVPGAGEGDAMTYTPKLCESCRKRPATLIFDGDDEPWFCDDCGFPCGDECCGLSWWEHAAEVLALEKMAAAPEGE